MGTLGTVGIADKGKYNPSATYIIGNSVYYGGSTWVAQKDNLTGITPEEGINWKYLARGFGSDNLGQIEGTDTSGVLGEVGAEVASQTLIDAIADRVMTKLIPYTSIANNFLATDPKTVLSGPMGKSLKDQLDTTNSNLGNGRYSTDLMIPQPTSALLYWDSNTLNTPYKHGMTGYAEGMALVTGNYNGFQTALAIPKGSIVMYIHTTNNGVPSGWQIYDIDRLGKKSH